MRDFSQFLVVRAWMFVFSMRAFIFPHCFRSVHYVILIGFSTSTLRDICFRSNFLSVCKYCKLYFMYVFKPGGYISGDNHTRNWRTAWGEQCNRVQTCPSCTAILCTFAWMLVHISGFTQPYCNRGRWRITVPINWFQSQFKVFPPAITGTGRNFVSFPASYEYEYRQI